MRLSKPVASVGGIAGLVAEGERKRHGKKDRRHARGKRGRETRRKEKTDSPVSHSLADRERITMRGPPSSHRPSSSFCPPVRSSVCLPVHPFVSSSASCHSPRQPSDGSRIRNSSPLLSSSEFSFCSFPAAAAAGLLLCTVLLPGRCLKFDPITCLGGPWWWRHCRSCDPCLLGIFARDNRARE